MKLEPKTLTGILRAFDTIKHDMEIKPLIGCADQDIQTVQKFRGEIRNLYIQNPERQ